VLLVSHNRYLLDRVTTRTLEIEAGHLTDYVGSYSAYRQEKQRRLLRQQEEYQAQQKEIRRLEAMIKRFERWEQMSDDPRIATRRRNKERTIERMEKIERPELKKQSITPRFAADSKGGRIALELKGYTRQISGKELFADVDLHIGYGERVGLLGANGSGKSTLFRDIVDHGAWDHTRIRLGPQVRLGYYSQEHETLDMERSIVEEMRQQPGLSKEGAFHILMNFMFSYLDMDQPVGTLSGGQKSRLQLAKLMAAEVNFLLLDEPTNHLDTYSQERVEEALEAFAGTILVISHDRYFLDRIVERIVEVETPTLRDHPGNFTQYWRRKTVVEPRPEEKRHNLNKASVAKVRTAPSPSQTDGQARRQVEAQLEMLEEEKEEITTALAAAYEAEEYDLAEELGRDLCPLEEEIDRLYTVWETLVAQLDGVE
jgi:ATP-binding cassette subfamily F protein 3